MSVSYEEELDPPAPMDDPDEPPPPDEDDVVVDTVVPVGVTGGALAIQPVAAVVVETPEHLIRVDSILSRLDGITAQDRAKAVMLGHAALEMRALETDEQEVTAAELLDAISAHQQHLDKKIRPFSDLAFKLHRGLTSFLSSATKELAEGSTHLRILLSRRLMAKRAAEEQRQREERERARKAEQERLLSEAAHAEAVGESPAVVAQILDDAATLPPPPVVERPITAAKGVSTRDNWKAELVDKHALILHVAKLLIAGDASLTGLLDVNGTAANQMAKAQKNTMAIPGLRAYNDASLTKRRTT